MKVCKRSGECVEVHYDAIKQRLVCLCTDDELREELDVDSVVIKTIQGIYDGITTSELDDLSARVCAAMQSVHTGYDLLAGRILVSNIGKSALHVVGDLAFSAKVNFLEARSPGLYNPEFLAFVRGNAAAIDAMVVRERDMRYNYFSVSTMRRGYLMKDPQTDAVVETPQDLWMRVAVAACCHRAQHPDLCSTTEDDLLRRLRANYDGMSLGRFTHATPTLFHAGTRFEQMSSCYLMGTRDSLADIYKTISDCAQISKWAGGIGVHISNVRARGSPINSTNGKSDGIKPAMGVLNATARYCNQSGRRKGSIAVYLEPWHLDVWDFAEMRKNTGADTERSRDLFLALMVPDVFMRAVESDGDWYLMSPDACPGLHDTYGEAFEELYAKYVAEGRYAKRLKAKVLWNHVLQCQLETGTPYVLFKDTINRCCNQNNMGTIRSSNLCAEITEYSDAENYAVCNLASIAVNRFVSVSATDGQKTYDFEGLRQTARLITRNLNRFIDVNFYPTPETQRSNMTARPVGIGIQGVADTLFGMGLAYEDEESMRLEAAIMETIYYGALQESVELAKVYGAYERFPGSPFSRGDLQFDLFLKSGKARHVYFRTDADRPDWEALKADVMRHGTRNSLLTALMPTASTSQIIGNSEAFEPAHSNVFKRTTLAGEFMVVNRYLMEDMRRLGLWTPAFVQALVRNDGSVQDIPGVPERYKQIYKTVWEVPQRALVQHAVSRAPFVDQSQSMNLFFAVPNTGKLYSSLLYSWKNGLKTGLYYLRSKPAREALRIGGGAAADGGGHHHHHKSHGRGGGRGGGGGGGRLSQQQQQPSAAAASGPACTRHMASEGGCESCSA